MCLVLFKYANCFRQKIKRTLILDAATKHGDGVIPTSSTRPLAQIACISTGPPGDSNLNDVIGSVIFTWPVSLFEITDDIIEHQFIHTLLLRYAQRDYIIISTSNISQCKYTY